MLRDNTRTLLILTSAVCTAVKLFGYQCGIFEDICFYVVLGGFIKPFYTVSCHSNVCTSYVSLYVVVKYSAKIVTVMVNIVKVIVD